MKRPLLLCLLWLVAGCAGMVPGRSTLGIESSAFPVDERAVEKMMAYVTVPTVSSREVAAAHKTLLTFLAQTPASQLVEAKTHAQSQWRLDQIHILDDCVAVQFAEGHYLETIFFAKIPTG